MSDTNQEQEDEVLRRMLATKPKPHKDEEPRGALGHARMARAAESAKVTRPKNDRVTPATD